MIPILTGERERKGKGGGRVGWREEGREGGTEKSTESLISLVDIAPVDVSFD